MNDGVTVREHRGTLSESMATARKVKDRAELCDIIQACLKVAVRPDQIRVERYVYDPRIKWDTHLVSIAGYGVWGMADGPL